MYQREGVWSWLRAVEWGVLALAVVDAGLEAAQGTGLLTPGLLAGLALASKLIRAMLAVLAGAKSSTVSPVSWLIAVWAGLMTQAVPIIKPAMETAPAVAPDADMGEEVSP